MDDLTAFLTAFQGRVKASRGKSPENDAILAIAEIWVEREIGMQEILSKIRTMATSLLCGTVPSYCSGAMKTMMFPGYAEKSEEDR